MGIIWSQNSCAPPTPTLPSMALPVGFVLSQIHRPDEKDSEYSEKDSKEEVDKTEVNENLKGVTAVIIEGNKENSKWLVVNRVQICHKSEETKEKFTWRCRAFSHYNCPFKIRTNKKIMKRILWKSQ